MTHSNTTHFGFETVGIEEKTQRVRDVFDSVASSYDRMNDVMSLGLHRLWKREFVAGLGLRDGMNILDLAGGTGDIAFLMRNRADAAITVCDINAEMLKVGRTRAFDKAIVSFPRKRESQEDCSPEDPRLRGDNALRWLCGNAESLPLPANQFDRCTIAFGIRNVTDIPAALKDIHRVLKPGGQFACLEFSEVKPAILKPLYERYSFELIPRFGEWIAKDRDSYQYLVESIRRFPNQSAFASMIRDAGFEQVSYRNLSAGVVAIHKGWKI